MTYLGPFLSMESTATIKTYKVEISNRDILRMALPISLAILVPQLNFITNNIFLGHLDKAGEALSTAGITRVYYLLFAVIRQGMNAGLQALIAPRAGEDRVAEDGEPFFQGILIALWLALIVILVTYFF